MISEYIEYDSFIGPRSSSCLYRIKNVVTGWFWTEIYECFECEKTRSLTNLNLGRHMNKELQSEWNKWGSANFEFVQVIDV